MPSLSRFVLALAAALTLGVCGAGAAFAAAANDDMVMGKANAPITVIEYASVGCPHCADWNKEVFPAFKAKYIDTGQVRYIAREILAGDPNLAAAGFLIARCAGKDR